MPDDPVDAPARAVAVANEDGPRGGSLRAGLLCRCPRCGEGRLLAGFLRLAPACERCGLDYGFADSGDGPAVFVILIVGIVVVGLALWLEVSHAPPLWVHVLLWVPLTLALSLPLLRSLKGLLVALQFRHQAAEGRIARP